MYNLIYSVVFWLFLSCHNNPSKSSEPGNREDSTNQSIESKSQSSDTSGFFSNCSNISTMSFTGYLQGIEASKDSLGKFHFFECYDCNETFELIFIYKRNFKIDNDSIDNRFKKGCIDYFAKFDCFAFVYPMSNPDLQKDVHSLNMTFPLHVSAFKHMSNDNWKLIKKQTMKDFKEFALFRFQTIHSIE